jgi:hypothetical protein
MPLVCVLSQVGLMFYFFYYFLLSSCKCLDLFENCLFRQQISLVEVYLFPVH